MVLDQELFVPHRTQLQVVKVSLRTQMLERKDILVFHPPLIVAELAIAQSSWKWGSLQKIVKDLLGKENFQRVTGRVEVLLVKRSNNKLSMVLVFWGAH